MENQSVLKACSENYPDYFSTHFQKQIKHLKSGKILLEALAFFLGRKYWKIDNLLLWETEKKFARLSPNKFELKMCSEIFI